NRKAKQNQNRSRKGKDNSQSRVPVTALIAWPGFDSSRTEPQGAKQIAAPAEPRTPNMHRAKPIAPRECGWKHGDSGHSAGETKPCSMKPVKNRLDSDRPSHGRRLHSLTRSHTPAAPFPHSPHFAVPRCVSIHAAPAAPATP